LPSVSINIVEGSLTGTHCPGAVTLMCEGTHLTILRWRYNSVHEIHAFLPNNQPAAIDLPIPEVGAFTVVELTSVSQSAADQRFGNFSSILSLDLIGLERFNVTDIGCSDPSTSAIQPVDIQLKKEPIPAEPDINNIQISTETSGSLVITVSWEAPVS